MKTKKLLAPVLLVNGIKRVSGFLYPDLDEGRSHGFVEMDSSRAWDHGMVVFLGVEVSSNEIFRRIVDSGKRIPSVPALMDAIEEYLRQVNEFRLGDLVKVSRDESGFKLVRVPTPSRTKSKLPK